MKVDWACFIPFIIITATIAFMMFMIERSITNIFEADGPLEHRHITRYLQLKNTTATGIE